MVNLLLLSVLFMLCVGGWWRVRGLCQVLDRCSATGQGKPDLCLISHWEPSEAVWHPGTWHGWSGGSWLSESKCLFQYDISVLNGILKNCGSCNVYWLSLPLYSASSTSASMLPSLCSSSCLWWVVCSNSSNNKCLLEPTWVTAVKSNGTGLF